MTPTSLRARAASWWSRGRKPAPWLHAAWAFGVGAALATGMSAAVIVLFFGGWLLALLVPLIATLAFGAGGAVALARRSGWWLGATVIAWTPASLAGLLPGPLQTRDGSSTTAVVLAGGLAAIAALLVHSGPPRLLACLLTAVLVATAPVVLLTAEQTKQEQADRDALIQARRRAVGGATFRPFVTSVDGYDLRGVGVTGIGVNSLGAVYDRTGTNPVALDMLLVTERDHPICDNYLIAVGENNVAEKQQTCIRHDSSWRRSSAHGIEVGHLDHGTLVRVVIHRNFDESIARQALQHARPMTGTEYHELLFPQQ